MIRFVYGSYGYGKTTEILNMIKRDTDMGKHTFLIIPDQEAVQFERLTLETLPPSAQLHLEIMSFSRLYNRVCREYGGLSYSYITKPLRSLYMWRSLQELSPLLQSYNGISASDMSVSDELIAMLGELKACGVTPAALEIAAKKLPETYGLSQRLLDMSLIFSCYDNLISEKYSDSADDLSRLHSVLERYDFFENSNIYIDSFSSFTGIQHKIIEQMFGGADNVTVTVPLESPDFSDISTDGIAYSHSRLLSSAIKYGGYQITILEKNRHAESAALQYLTKNLWRLDLSTAHVAPPENDGSIVCELCDNRYAEAEAICAHILELLRSGARCRDIVIIFRDVEKYRGIIDTALQKSDIPFFISQSSDLCSVPAVKFIISALRIKRYNWQKRDVISHLKTGLCDIDARDADLFEEYVNTWNINGSLFFEDEWTMNPDGFVEKRSERAEQILRAANSVKRKFTEPLGKLFVLLDAAEDIPQMCRAMFQYISEISLEQKLIALAQREALEGNTKAVGEYMRTYGIILNVLADIATALEGESADTEEFMHILRNMFNKTEISSIPTSIDEVTIGSAAMLRATNPKYVFVAGLCEGEFPQSVKDTGVLSEADRKELSSLGIELSGNADIRNSDELMYVKRAFSAARKRLYIFSHSTELDGKPCFPSLAWRRVEKLFGSELIHSYSTTDLYYTVPSPRCAVSVYRALDPSPQKEALKVALRRQIPEFSSMCDTVSFEDNCKVSPENVKAVTGGYIRFSATSFESYVKCPFGYFCSNVLKLRVPVDDKFNFADMGSFVHYVLEVLIKYAIPDTPELPFPSDKELLQKAEAAGNTYIEKICPPSLIGSKRLAHLYDRLKKLALLLVRNAVNEFSQSDFRPAFFELRADGRDGRPSPLIFTLEGGTQVSFGGIMDRVDIYKKDGNAYIRIVDYKTGSKTFSLDDIAEGINLQMLIYLFTLCRSSSTQFKKALGIEPDGNALPAGVIYLSAAIPTVEAEDYDIKESVLKKAETELTRSGLILNDEEILYAMNHSLDSSFLAGIKKNKDGMAVGGALTSEQGFAEIMEQIEDTVSRIAGELISGNADVAPLSYGKENPCDYCEAKPICRKKR